MQGESCPLCHNGTTESYYSDQVRSFRQCGQCQLVFVAPQYHLSPEREKAEYDLHENSPDDIGYRAFLSRLVEPLQARIKPGAKGLDFGCGPGPTLSVMLEERGFSMSLYDPYYFDDRSLLVPAYDFITATEVVEHLAQPGKIFEDLWDLLPASGCLGLMTKLLASREAFASWHYKNDLTHICFYSRDCFHYIATMLDADLQILGKDVIFLTKK